MNTTDNILEELDVLIEDSLRNSNPIGVTLCYARSTIANYRARIAEFWDALETVREQRDEARGQRDRLAEAIQDAIDCRMIPITSANEGGAAKYSIQVRTADKLREALQSLTQPTEP